MEDCSTRSTRSPWLYRVYDWLKFVLCITNIIIFICGSVLLGLSMWMKYGSSSFVNIIGSYSTHFLDVVFLCIIVGCIMCMLGCLGFYGAYMEDRFLLWLFFLFMLLFTAVTIAAIVLILTISNSLESFLKEQGLTSLKEIYYATGNKGVVTESWNMVMGKLHCCGAFNYSDFELSTFSNKTGLKYPKSCCRDPNLVQCDGTNVTKQVLYMKGCFSVILEKVRNDSRWLGSAAVYMTLMALASLIIALMLSVKHGD